MLFHVTGILLKNTVKALQGTGNIETTKSNAINFTPLVREALLQALPIAALLHCEVDIK